MRSLSLLAARLAQSHDVHLAYPEGSLHAEALAAAGVTLHPLSEPTLDQSTAPALARRWPFARGLPTALAVPRWFASTPPQVVRFARLARSIEPDVVHLNEGVGFNRGATIGSAMALVPTIVHVRTVQHLSPIDRVVGRLVARFVAVSEAAAAPYRNAGFASRTVVIPNCIDLPETTSEVQRDRAAADLGLDAGVIVLTAGRLIHRKGNHVALAAIAELRRRGLDVGLVILGDGPERARLAATAQDFGVADYVGLPGYQEDIAAFYRASDILLLPTQTHLEGFPRAVLEGMAYGLPVVATDIGGSREVFEDGVSGVLVRRMGAEPIVAALEPLVRDPSLRAVMGHAGRERVARQFSCKQHVDAVLAVYAEVLAADGRSPDPHRARIER